MRNDVIIMSRTRDKRKNLGPWQEIEPVTFRNRSDALTNELQRPRDKLGHIQGSCMTCILVLRVDAILEWKLQKTSSCITSSIGNQKLQPLFPQGSVGRRVQDGGRGDKRNKVSISILSILIQMNTSMRSRYCLEK